MRPLAPLLAGLGRLASRRPWTVLLGLALVTAAAAPLAYRTVRRIDYDLFAVLTRGLPRAEAYKRIGREFGITDRHLLVVETRSRQDLSAAKDLAGRLAAGMAADRELVREARARLELREFLSEHACLYLDPESARLLAERFSDAGLARAMQRNAALLAAGPQLRARVTADPLNLAELIPELAARRSPGGLGLDPEGYAVSRDGKMVLVSVRPAGAAGDHRFTARLMAYTRQVIEREGAGSAGRLHVEVAGAYAHEELHSRLMFRGIARSAISSLVVILLMFALAYRRAASLLFVGLPLVAPVVWTLAAAPLFLGGRISLLGGAFVAVLLGLGVDFAIHLYNRYVSERAAGRSPEEAAQLCVTATGEGVVVGALTTVAAFAGMALTRFRGFVEFGTMAALGVFLTMVALLAAVPAAMAALDRTGGRRGRVPPQPLGFGLEGLHRLVRARAGTMVLAGLLFLAAALAGTFADPRRPGLRFESDVAAIGPPASVDTAGALNKRVARAFGLADREASVLVAAPSAAEALARTAEVRRRAAELVAAGRLTGMRSILDLVPSDREQERSLELARALGLPELPARLARAAEAAGLAPAAFADFSARVTRMAERVRARRKLEVERLEDPTVAELAGFLFRAPGAPGSGDGLYRTHSLLALAPGSLDSAGYAALERDLGLDGRDAQMTSAILVALELKDCLQTDLPVASAVVLGIVLLTLGLSLRRPVYVALALAPVAIGAAGTFLVMRLFGIDLNYVNVLFFPVLAGIGVDNAVHLIIRFRQDGDTRGAVTEVGRALVLCSATTIWGFFALYQPMLSPPHWGMRSLGLMVAVGMAFALAASLTFVPAVLELLARRSGPKPAPAFDRTPAAQ